MQIDFHFGVTYVVSRIAGFKKEEAYKIVQEAAHNEDYFKISFKDKGILSLDEINLIFNPKNYIKNIDYIYDKVFEK